MADNILKIGRCYHCRTLRNIKNTREGGVCPRCGSRRHIKPVQLSTPMDYIKLSWWYVTNTIAINLPGNKRTQI